MRRWWQNWGIIDLLGLGLGLGLSLSYTLVYYSFNQRTPFANLWPNLATEILGVWLSVRIIDQLIQRRESFHSSRQNLLGDISVFVETLYGFFPSPEAWKLHRLDSLLGWVEESRQQRLRFLHTEEISLVNQCIDLASDAYQECSEYLDAEYEVIEREGALKSVLSEANKVRSEVETALTRIRFGLGQLAIEANVQLREVLPNVDNMIAVAKTYLSTDELRRLREFKTSIEDTQEFDYVGIETLTRELLFVGGALYLHNMSWHRIAEQTYKTIEQRPAAEDRWHTLLSTAKEKLIEEKDDYPDTVADAGLEYLTALQRLGEKALAVLQATTNLTNRYETLTRNILQETRLQ
jgi:hypothetical protein